MKVGLLADWPASEAAGGGLEAWTAAERVGFEAVWLLERGATDAGVLLRAAALAQFTERIRIGIASPPPATLHPLRLAEDLAMLDLVSDGRLDWIPIAGDPARAGSEDETIEIVLRAWRGEPFAHAGRHHAFPELVCLPRPRQDPHPPIWLPHGAARPSTVDTSAFGHWIADRSDIDSARPGVPLALICTLALDGSANAERPSRSMRPARQEPPEPISLSGDRGRCREELSHLLEQLSPDWLILAPRLTARPDESAIADCLRFVDEVIAR